MAKKEKAPKPEKLYPFLDGELMRYEGYWTKEANDKAGRVLKTAAEVRFSGTVRLETYSKGRSAMNFVFRLRDNSRIYMFLTDFFDCVHLIDKCVLTGTFEPVKRGGNYAWKLIRDP